MYWRGLIGKPEGYRQLEGLGIDRGIILTSLLSQMYVDRIYFA
jgi:hypothetical protein